MSITAKQLITAEEFFLTIYRNEQEGRLLHESAMIDGEDVLFGFQCRVSDLLP